MKTIRVIISLPCPDNATKEDMQAGADAMKAQFAPMIEAIGGQIATEIEG